MNKKKKRDWQRSKYWIKLFFYKAPFALIYFILFASLKHFFLDNTLGFFHTRMSIFSEATCPNW